jgi:hypothetical protein
MTNSASRSIDPERLARLEEMLDRQDILDCFTRLTRGSDRADRELFLSAFHPDATVDVGQIVAGPEVLYDWSARVQETGQASSHHHILNHTCEIDGDVAHAETYYFFLARNRDGTNGVIGGRYVCRLERRDCGMGRRAPDDRRAVCQGSRRSHQRAIGAEQGGYFLSAAAGE